MTALLNKTRQIEAILRENIRQGVWSVGGRMPAEDSLMDEFGVSRPSMREALNTLASEGIVERRHGSGTFVKRMPVGRIAIYSLLSNITSPLGYWHRDMVSKISDSCRAMNLRAEILVVHGRDIDEVNESFERSLDFLPKAELEGAICLTPSPAFNGKLSEAGVPHVSLIGGMPGLNPCVMLDYEAMSRMFRDQMLLRGHTNYVVMHVDEPAGTISSKQREYLSRCHLIAAGGDSSRLLSVSSIEDAYTIFRHWWRQGRRSDRRAIVFFDDALCDVCCKAIWEENIRVPEDLAILTHANNTKQFVLPVQLDRVSYCAQEAADEVWALLNKVRGEKPGPDPCVLIEPHVVDGQSL